MVHYKNLQFYLKLGMHLKKVHSMIEFKQYTVMAILNNSKILMYDFFYNQLKANYRPRCEPIYMDMDSLLLDIQTEVIYQDMLKTSICTTKQLSQRALAVQRHK